MSETPAAAGHGHDAVQAKPATPAGNKPAAPETHNKEVGSATQDCPLKHHKVCNCEKLKIEVEIEGEFKVRSEKKKSQLETTKMQRLKALPASVKDKKVRDLMSKYDIVIDVIAGYPSRTEIMPRDKFFIIAEAEYEGTCPVHDHPVLSVKPLNYKAPDWAKSLGEAVAGKAPFAKEWVNKTVQETATQQLKTGVWLEREGFVKKEPGAHELKIAEHHPYCANPLSGDFAEGGGRLTVIFDIIRSLWPMHEPAMFEVTATSCGKPEPQHPQNVNLVGAVRAFRKDVIAIGIKIPPLGSFKHEREGVVTGLGTKHQEVEHKQLTEATLQTRDGRYHNRTENTQTAESEGGLKRPFRHGEEEKTTEKAWWAGRDKKVGVGKGVGDDREKKEEIGSPGRLSRVHEELNKYEIGIILKRNGKEIDFLDEPEPAAKLDKNAHPGLASAQHTGGQLAGKISNKTARDIVIGGLTKGIKLVAGFMDALKKMPQMGWKFEVEVSVFSGEILLEWGPNYVDEPVVPGRYLAVEHMFDINIGTNILHFMAALSFGIEVRAAGTGVTLKAEGKVTLDIPVKFIAVLSVKRKPEHEVDVRPLAIAEIKLIGDASVLGWTVAHAEGGVGTSFSMDDGKLECGTQKKLHLTGTLKRNEIEATWWWKGPSKPPKEPGHHKIVDEAVLHVFS